MLEVVSNALALPVAKTRRLAMTGAARFLFAFSLEGFFMLYLGLAARFCFVERALSFRWEGLFH